MNRRILIDGYNLLFATDIFASESGPPTLERTRAALLAFLAAALSEADRRRTTIVFDAAQAPAGLPHKFAHDGIEVLFSRNPADADALLEDLLADAKSAKGWLIVSSDHRVQRAARSRGAKSIDSETWFRELKRKPGADSRSDDEKPALGTINPFPPGYGDDLSSGS